MLATFCAAEHEITGYLCRRLAEDCDGTNHDPDGLGPWHLIGQPQELVGVDPSPVSPARPFKAPLHARTREHGASLIGRGNGSTTTARSVPVSVHPIHATNSPSDPRPAPLPDPSQPQHGPSQPNPTTPGARA